MNENNDIHLSKTLCWILRHEAIKLGLPILVNGYIPVSIILKHPSLRNYSTTDVERVVVSNVKQRFGLRNNNGVLEICANQGHSISVVDNSNLIPLNGDENIDVIHGTFYKNWESIKIEGLSRAKRNHIHFALGLPSDKSVISGVRKNCQVFIYINLKLATSDNLKFYRSANGVILSPGNENGFILPKYFIKVLDRSLINLI